MNERERELIAKGFGKLAESAIRGQRSSGEADHLLEIAREAKAYATTLEDTLVVLSDRDTPIEPLECRGHETTSGPIGSTTYCDGSCRRRSPLRHE